LLSTLFLHLIQLRKFQGFKFSDKAQLYPKIQSVNFGIAETSMVEKIDRVKGIFWQSIFGRSIRVAVIGRELQVFILIDFLLISCLGAPAFIVAVL